MHSAIKYSIKNIDRVYQMISKTVFLNEYE